MSWRRGLLYSVYFIHHLFLFGDSDVKPENFMIGAHSNCIKVIDFGLSDYFEDGNHRHWRPGKTNELVGTVRYMSVNGTIRKSCCFGCVSYFFISICC